MIKRFVASLSVLSAFVGVWVLSRGHAQIAACSASPKRLLATAHEVCPQALSTYLMGVALTAGGLTVTCLIAYAIVKQVRSGGWMEKLPEIPAQSQRVIGTAFGSDLKVTTSR